MQQINQEIKSGTPAVLVAEDNPDDAFFLKSAFLDAAPNLPVHFVRNGLEAVDYLRARLPSSDRTTPPLPKLLLLDLKMPTMSGFDVLEWLRGQPGLTAMIVGVISGLDHPAQIERATVLGARFFISKPCSIHQLSAAVQQLTASYGLASIPNVGAVGPIAASGHERRPGPP